MIKIKKLNKRYPNKAIERLREDIDNPFSRNRFFQHRINRLEHPEVFGWALEASGIAKGHSDNVNMIFHTIGSDIPLHRDKMSRHVKLIPIKTRPTVELVLSTPTRNKRAPLERGHAYIFSDFSLHGLDNPNFTQFECITID